MPYLTQTFASRSEAEFAAQALESEGVACAVSASDAGGAIPAIEVLSPVRIEVADHDLERAAEIVNDLGFDGPLPAKPLTTRERWQGWILGVGLFVVVAWMLIHALQNPPSAGHQDAPPQAQTPW